MRSQPLLPVSARLALALLMAACLAPFGCRGSNTITGSINGTGSSSGINLSGSWTGTFQPDDLVRCASSPASATLQQNGGEVTGNLTTSDCGVAGHLDGTLHGNTVLGRITMQGCTGGGFSGTIEGSRLSLSIGDLTKPLVTGETPVMTGGVVTLHRQWTVTSGS
jgi:hypothetical protein